METEKIELVSRPVKHRGAESTGGGRLLEIVRVFFTAVLPNAVGQFVFPPANLRQLSW